MFSTPTCIYCKRAKRYFRARGVPFKDVDVSRDMVRRSGQQGVPVIGIGGKIIVGFEHPKIDSILGSH